MDANTGILEIPGHSLLLISLQFMLWRPVCSNLLENIDLWARELLVIYIYVWYICLLYIYIYDIFYICMCVYIHFFPCGNVPVSMWLLGSRWNLRMTQVGVVLWKVDWSSFAGRFKRLFCLEVLLTVLYLIKDWIKAGIVYKLKLWGEKWDWNLNSEERMRRGRG